MDRPQRTNTDRLLKRRRIHRRRIECPQANRGCARLKGRLRIAMISDDRLVSSKRRAEKPLARGLDPRGGAFRLHIVVRPPVLQSLPYPTVCPRAWISKPLACLWWFINAALSRYGSPSTHRRNDECGRSAGCSTTVLHRVEMGVVHVSRKVPIVAYRVLPIPTLPNAPLAAAGHHR